MILCIISNDATGWIFKELYKYFECKFEWWITYHMIFICVHKKNWYFSYIHVYWQLGRKIIIQYFFLTLRNLMFNCTSTKIFFSARPISCNHQQSHPGQCLEHPSIMRRDKCHDLYTLSTNFMMPNQIEMLKCFIISPFYIL